MGNAYDDEHIRNVVSDLERERVDRIAVAQASAPRDKEPLDTVRVLRESRTGALGKMSDDELAIKLQDLYYVDHPAYRTNQQLIELINLLGQYE